LDVILSLKNLGMKLREIKHYLTKSSVVDRMGQLAAQEAVIQKKSVNSREPAA
jgi:DNA-binding transcriptional MerR regulator